MSLTESFLLRSAVVHRLLQGPSFCVHQFVPSLTSLTLSEQSDVLGQISTAHMAIADQKGPRCAECIKMYVGISDFIEAVRRLKIVVPLSQCTPCIRRRRLPEDGCRRPDVSRAEGGREATTRLHGGSLAARKRQYFQSSSRHGQSAHSHLSSSTPRRTSRKASWDRCSGWSRRSRPSSPTRHSPSTLSWELSRYAVLHLTHESRT